MSHKPCFLVEESRPLGLEHRATIEDMLARFPSPASEMTFMSLFAWSELWHILVCERDGHLILSFRDHHGRLALLPPIGPRPAEVMGGAIAGVRSVQWAYVPEELARAVPGAHPLHDRANDDYVYRIDDLRALAGKKYDGKRNFIRRFAALGPTVRQLIAADVPAMLRIQERWLAGKDGDVGARDESTALEKTLMHFADLPLHAVGVFLGSALAGFAVGVPLNADTFVEHFEKAVPNLTGVYPYLLHAFAKSLPESFLYLNREQDLGVPGIRKAKESWQPVTMVRKYTVKGKCV